MRGSGADHADVREGALNRRLFARGMILAALGVVATVTLADDGRVETGATLGADARPALAAVLEPSGWRAMRGDGSIAAEVWLARSLAQIEDGGLVGAARVPAGGQDVRGRTLSASLYTLRYVKVPPGDRHGSCLRHPDFLVLIRAGDDPEPSQRLPYFEMAELSARVVGGRHPATWQAQILPPAPAGPSLATNGSGNEVLTVPLPLASGQVTLAILLRGSLSR